MRLRVYRDERRPVALAAAATCLLEAAEALVANSADALYLARRGVSGLGTQLAISSGLLVLTLGTVGALADRWPRARLLFRLAIAGALLLVLLRVALSLAPDGAAALVFVGGKQLAAAVDLAFWVLVLDCFDARQTRRIVPLLMAAGGVGLVAGSLLIKPLVGLIAVDNLVVVAAGAYLGGAALVSLLARAARPAALPVHAGILHAARDGARDAVRIELARRLLFIVAIAGAFAPVIYTALGAAASSVYPGEADLASFYGRFRGLTNLVALVAQLFIAPALVGLLGVGSAFLVGPIAGLVAGAALAARGGLAVAALAQAVTRVADAAVQTGAEKLAHNLLPRESRGRIVSFLDGFAKRGGALAGGLAVTAVGARIVWVGVLAAVLAAAWGVAALLLRRRYPTLAVAAMATRRTSDQDVPAVDEATLRHLRRDLAGRDEDRRELALEAVLRGPAEVTTASIGMLLGAAREAPASRGRLLLVLDSILDDPTFGPPPPRAGRDLLAFLEESADPVERAAIVQAIGRLASDDDFAAARPLFERLAGDPASTAVRLCAEAALARRDRRPPDALDAALADALTLSAASREAAALALLRGTRSGDDGIRTIALEELRVEAQAVAAGRVPPRAEPGRLLARLAVVGSVEERRAALRTLGDAAAAAPELFRPHVLAGAREALADPPLRPAALQALAALRDARLGPLFTRALGDGDGDVREAAGAALRRLGRDALPVLLVGARFGPRPVRQSALEILRGIESLPAACDDLVEAELRELWIATLRLTAVAAAPLAQAPAGRLLCNRLEERLAEIGRTLLVAVEVRAGDARVGQAARRLHDRRARARALEALDAILPRTLARRVVPALEDAPLEERASRARAALDTDIPALEDALRAELAGDDALGRLLTIHALGRAERAALRDAILGAAQASADSLDPLELLRRVHEEDDPDMPSSVETMLLLQRVPIFADLGASQIAELAGAVVRETLAPGESLEIGEGLAICISGRLRAPGGEIGPGDQVGIEALFSAPPGAQAIATEKSRILRILRDDFRRVVEDSPAIALAICRSLIERRNVT